MYFGHLLMCRYVHMAEFCLYVDVQEYCFRGAAEEVSGSMWMETPHG